MSSPQWPAARDFQEAIQNPLYTFTDPELRQLTPALDRLGMPIVTSGQFAYVFKLKSTSGAGAQAIRCFRQFLGDREKRYQSIDRHLDATTIPSVAGFDYYPEGIVVLGRKLPLLVMEWIEGLPLDVYVGDVFERPDVLMYLADSWLKITSSLKAAGVAHGDLQHGNIIVENDDLRLVDLDGMFVPEMAGWQASENGHQHYQHPARSAKHFSDTLDNFSALVIYISLLAIAEAPELWREFHDENLIFTKADFEQPSSSLLFAKLKKLSSVKQFVAILESASRGDPLNCPYLLDLVASPSKLPGWMKPVPIVQTKTISREQQATSNAPPPVQSQFRRETTGASPVKTSPWWRQPPPAAPLTTSSPQSPFNPVLPQQPLAPLPVSNRSFFSLQATSEMLNYATGWLVWIWIWFPLFFLIFEGAGAPARQAGFLAFASYLGICQLLGYRKIWQPPTASSVSRTPASSAPAGKAIYRPPYQPTPPPPVSIKVPNSVTATIVGNRISQVYHTPSCGWANKIRARNRVMFTSQTQALGRGFRPCSMCKP